MHKIGLLKNALSSVKHQALKEGLRRVDLVELVVGKMQGITADSLALALEIARADEPMFARCRVKVKEVEGAMECLDCHGRFSLDKPADSCPSCHGPNLKLISGLEFYVDSYSGS